MHQGVGIDIENPMRLCMCPKTYGSVAHFKWKSFDSEIKTTFVLANSRITLLRPLTLPWLSLMEAVKYNIKKCPIDGEEFNFIHLIRSLNGNILKKVGIRSKDPKDDPVADNCPRCEVCRRGDREHHLLLCGACALPYHCGCLDPPLSHPPMEQWFCPPCASVIAQMEEGALPSTSQSRRVIPGTWASESIRGRVQNRRTNLNSQSKAFYCAGAGPFGKPMSYQTAPSSPGAISAASIRAVVEPTAIYLWWEEPSSNGAPILNYNIEIGDALYAADGENLERRVEGLIPETIYKVRVQAVNSVGPGPFSPPVKLVTRALSPILRCGSSSHNSLQLKWGVGKNCDLKTFTLELMTPQTKKFTPVYQGPGNTFKITKFQELTSYNFRIYASSKEGDGPFSDIFTFTTQKAPALEGPKVLNISKTSCNVELLTAKEIGKDMLSCKLQFGTKLSDFHEASSQTTSTESNLQPAVTKHLGLCTGTAMPDVRSNPGPSSQGSSSDQTFPQCDQLINLSENFNQHMAVSAASKHAVLERARNTLSSLLQGALAKKKPSECHSRTLQKPGASSSSSAKDISEKTRKIKKNKDTKQAAIESNLCLNKKSSDLYSKHREKPIGSFSISPVSPKNPLKTDRLKDKHVSAKISSSTYHKNFATKSCNTHLASIPTSLYNLSDKKQLEKSQKTKPSNMQDTVPDFRLDTLQKRASFLEQFNTKSNAPATKHSGESSRQSSLFHESNTLTGCNVQKLSQHSPAIKGTLSQANETKIKDEPPSYETISKKFRTENSTPGSKQEYKIYHNLINTQLLEDEEQLEVKQVLRNGCIKVKTPPKVMSVHRNLSPARRPLVPNKRTFYFEQVKQHFNSEDPQKNSVEKDKHNRERDSDKNNKNTEKDKFSKKKSNLVKDGPFIEGRKRSFEDSSIYFTSDKSNLENKRRKMFIKANKQNSDSSSKSCLNLDSTSGPDKTERLAAFDSSKHYETILDVKLVNQNNFDTKTSRKQHYESMCSVDSSSCFSDISQLSNEILPNVGPFNSPILEKAVEQEHSASSLKGFLMKEKMTIAENEDDFEIKEFPKKGCGIVTKKAIARGEFVMEYHGELIGHKEAVLREAAYTAENTGSYMYYFKCCNKSYCIDATKESGRLGRLINHSKKSGNLKTQSLLVGGSPRLALFASRAIEPGEELLYDYGDRRRQVLEWNPWLIAAITGLFSPI